MKGLLPNFIKYKKVISLIFCFFMLISLSFSAYAKKAEDRLLTHALDDYSPYPDVLRQALKYHF